MKTIQFLGVFLLLFLILPTSCVEDNGPENEQELITTVLYKLVPDGGGDEVVFSFVDMDGDGGIAPVITTTGKLQSNKTYLGTITLSNDASMPPRDITTEIKEEADDHQFFFLLTSTISNKIDIMYADIDNNANPVGLLTNVSVGSGSQGMFGKLKLVLRHLPNKNAEGVKDGLITNAGGETDIEIEFEVAVQ
ncbi:MAG: type 1 periplasmic binding fold superfamily protein [Saprospiraceae bacterium]